MCSMKTYCPSKFSYKDLQGTTNKINLTDFCPCDKTEEQKINQRIKQ